MKENVLATNPSYNILLAEDDPDDQDLLKDAFTELPISCKLHIVSDGKAAIKYLQDTPADNLPCLIVLDYNMPELNGAKVLELLCSDNRYKDIPKVILSTSNSPYYIDECLNIGADAYKVKPSNYHDLVKLAGDMVAMCKVQQGK